MKKNEKKCTSHISVEKVLAILTKVNEVYATIHRLVKGTPCWDCPKEL
jgi:hypothetical protein